MTSEYIPIFEYPGGKKIEISDLPKNSTFKWIDDYGGGKLDGPIKWNTKTPSGTKAHGGVLTIVQGKPVIEFHRSLPSRNN